MTVPVEVAALIRGRPQVGDEEQAFPLLTVDEIGFPHVALLSRAELDVASDLSALFAVVASRRTSGNLERDRKAGLSAVEGTTAHYLKLEVGEFRRDEGLAATVLHVVDHVADSLGIPLEPIRFPATGEVAAIERWNRSEAVLKRLGAG
jgi:hypothetical protein